MDQDLQRRMDEAMAAKEASPTDVDLLNDLPAVIDEAARSAAHDWLQWVASVAAPIPGVMPLALLRCMWSVTLSPLSADLQLIADSMETYFSSENDAHALQGSKAAEVVARYPFLAKQLLRVSGLDLVQSWMWQCCRGIGASEQVLEAALRGRHTREQAASAVVGAGPSAAEAARSSDRQALDWGSSVARGLTAEASALLAEQYMIPLPGLR